MIYEMRVYRCLPGRLPALLKRFETITLKLWEKHGIKTAGFFTTLVGESNQELTYLVAWESLAEREKKWAAFQSDPDWIALECRPFLFAFGERFPCHEVGQLLIGFADQRGEKPSRLDAVLLPQFQRDGLEALQQRRQ